MKIKNSLLFILGFFIFNVVSVYANAPFEKDKNENPKEANIGRAAVQTGQADVQPNMNGDCGLYAEAQNSYGCVGNYEYFQIHGTPFATVEYLIGGESGTTTFDVNGWAYVSFIPTSEYTQIELVTVTLNDCSQSISSIGSFYAEPQPQLSEISGPTQVCGGSTDNYNVTNSSSSNNNNMYYNQIWYNLYPYEAGQIDYNTGTVYWNNSYNGTATIEAYYNGMCGSDHKTLMVEVNNNLWADVNNNNYYYSNSCIGQTGYFDINGTPNAIVSYDLNGQFGSITLDQWGWGQVNFQITNPSNSINLMSVSLNSCSNSNFYNSYASLYAQLPPQLAPISGPTEVCGGSTANYNTFNMNGNGYNYYYYDQVHYNLNPSEAGQIDSYSGAVTWSSTFTGTAFIDADYMGMCGFDMQNLVVEVMAPTPITTTEASCNSYFWMETEQTYTQSGTYYGAINNCQQQVLELTINTTPVADAPSNVSVCDSYTLPALTAGNYFTGANGGGTALNAGDEITATQTIYVYAANGTCSDENSFVVNITTTPAADAPSNVTACDSYTLPALSVGNYFTGANGEGTALSAGTAITASQTIYVYAENGICTSENSFDVTINTTPTSDSPSDVSVCDSYTLPALTAGNYFTGANGEGTALSAGETITATQTIYVYAENGSCSSENSFVVTINTTPEASVSNNNYYYSCVGQNGSFQINGTPNATVSYELNYQFGSITLDQMGSGQVNFQITNTYNSINLMSVSLNSCSNSNFSNSYASLYADYPVQLSEISGPTQVCGGSTDNYYASNMNGGGYASIYYSLYPSEAGQIDSYTGTVTWSNNFNGTASISAESNSMMCGGDYKYLTVEVNNNLWAEVNNNNYYYSCVGQNGSFQINGTPNATVSYELNYQFGSITLDQMGSGQVNFQITNTYNSINLMSVSLNSCSNSNFSNSYASLYADYPVQLSEISGPTQVCGGSTDNYYTSNMNNGGGYASIYYSLYPSEAGQIDSYTGTVTWSNNFNGTASISAESNSMMCGGDYKYLTVEVSTPTPIISTEASCNSYFWMETEQTYTQSGTYYGAINNCQQQVLELTINTPVTADSPSDVSACDSYTLPALTVGNYFTEPNGGGIELFAGNVITSSQTIYVYAENGSCVDENSFEVTINTTPTVDAPSNVSACDIYTLPALSSGNYLTGPNGGGEGLSAGYPITASNTIYVYATNEGCAAENSFDVTINTTPSIISTIGDWSCDASTLTLEATPSAGTINWYSLATGGNSLFTGTSFTTPSISTTKTYYAQVANGSCVNNTRSAVVATIGGCTKIQASQCGVTISSPTTTIWATSVTGATAYRFEIMDMSTNAVYYVNSATRYFTFSQFPYENNTTYSIRVSSLTGNVYSVYGAACTVTYDRRTALQASQCGVTISSPTTTIWATSVTGATAYRFEITDMSTNAVYYVNSATRYFTFSQFAYENNTTYSIKVSYLTGNVYSAYGGACTVTYDKRTALQASQCGVTISSPTTTIWATSVTGATAYRFEIMDMSTNAVYYVNSATRYFTFSQFAYENNTTYSIRVSTLTGNVYSVYGAACTVTYDRRTALQASQCGVTISSPTTGIWATSVTGATAYRFEITDLNNSVIYLENATRNFKFNQFAYTPGMIYSVKVSYKLGMNYSNYGQSCIVTAPGASAAKPGSEITDSQEPVGENEQEIAAVNKFEGTYAFEAFPNPSNGDFTISSSDAGTFNIINELGQLVRTVEITEANGNQVKVENMPNGAYFVTGTLNGEVVTKKVMVVR